MRLLSKCASQKSPLLLAAGECADLAIAKVLQVHGFKGLMHGSAVLFPKPLPPAQCLISAHFNHAAHCDREIPVDRRALRQISYLRNGRASIMTVETHRSRFERHKSYQRFKK